MPVHAVATLALPAVEAFDLAVIRDIGYAGYLVESKAPEGPWFEVGDHPPHRLAEGAGFSFAIADADTDRAVGGIGLWLAALAHGRATAGYSVVPSARGRGVAVAALTALTCFAWTIPDLHRIELYIEPWNTGSVKTAERAGYEREGLLRSHQEIGGLRRDMLLYAIVRENPPA